MNTSIDTRMAKAMAHPVRAEALRVLNQRVASPSDIAREIGLPVANVSYHVNTLLRLGCIEEVEFRHVRGAVEHRYQAVRRPVADLPDSASMPPSVRSSIAAKIFENAARDAHAALAAGTVGDRADVHFVYTPMELDDEGWAQVHDILQGAYDEIEGVREEAKARIGAGAEPIPARVTILQYPAPADAPA